MMSGTLSESMLVNLGDSRFFQHGGNLMVNKILVDFHENIFI